MHVKMEPAELFKIEIKEEMYQTQPKSEPVTVTFDTIQTKQIIQEDIDYANSTACSNIQNFDQVSQGNNEKHQLMQSHSPAVCRSTSAKKIKQRPETLDKHFSCDICTKTFSRKGYLQRHFAIHTGQKPFMCDVCNKTFIQRWHLDTHLLTHTGHKPFICDICTKTFSRKWYLNTHLLTHTAHKPFTCDICTKTFSQKAHLKSHLLTHTGHKPFICAICTKTFSLKGDLKRHLTQTAHKPFVCDICTKTFSQIVHLETHRLTHNGKKQLKCDIQETKNLNTELNFSP